MQTLTSIPPVVSGGVNSLARSDKSKCVPSTSPLDHCLGSGFVPYFLQPQWRLGLGYNGVCGCEGVGGPVSSRTSSARSALPASAGGSRHLRHGRAVSCSYSDSSAQQSIQGGHPGRGSTPARNIGSVWRTRWRTEKRDRALQRLGRMQQGRSTLPTSGARAATVEKDSGKVGVCARLGNISLASFGLKAPAKQQRQKVDIAKTLSRMLPFVVVATAVSALAHPPTFSWFSKKYYAPALGGIMLSIGVQLSVSSFLLVFKRPLPVLLGFVAQYVMKPMIGLAVVTAFRVPPAYAAGLLLTASVAGAQLSSYAAFLGDGDVAYSIVLTSLSTIASVALTPLLTQLLIGSVVPVDPVAMAKSILQVVICPVLIGLGLNTYARLQVDMVRPVMPLLAMACTSLCIGSPLALNRSMILSVQGLHLLAPVVAFHLLAFAAGYWFTRCGPWRQDEKMARTVSLCTGMQSSTLAMLLASQFLGSTHSVPPACSVVIMAVVGLSLGSFWGKGQQLRDLVPLRQLSDSPFSAAYN